MASNEKNNITAAQEVESTKYSELELLLSLDWLVDTPGTLVDVGAHIGGWSIAFANLGWTIIAFEPDSENFQELSNRLRYFEDAFPIQKAVDEVTASEVPFYRSTENWGIHSLKAFHESHTEQTHVDTIRLDEALKSLSVDSVTVLKIDAEGADFPALKSFDLDAFRPLIVQCEFMDERTWPHFGYTHHDIVEHMSKRGYIAYMSEWAPIFEHSRRGGGGGPFTFLQCVRYPVRHDPAWGNLLFIGAEDQERFEVGLVAYLERLGGAVQKAVARVPGLERGISASHERVAELEKAVARRDERNRELERAVAQRDARRAELESAVRQRDSRIRELQEAVARRDERYKKLERAVALRDAARAQLEHNLKRQRALLWGLGTVALISIAWALAAALS